jgi:hypothetical protein
VIVVNANSAIFQLYYGEKKLIFARDDDEQAFICCGNLCLNLYCIMENWK